MRTVRVATDIGGTFTDLVYYEIDREGRSTSDFRIAKGRTTPPDFERGLLDVVAKCDFDPGNVEFFAHGATVVINALLERKGARTALLTTRGFRDTLEIARGEARDFFNPLFRKPPPFVRRRFRREVDERMSFKGEVLTPLDLAGLPAILDEFREAQIEAIAICLLHSYANPAHELAVAQKVRELWPEVVVVTSHEVCREWREYERTNTSVLSAYVQPVVSRYLQRLTSGLKKIGCGGQAYIMQSNGGIETVRSIEVRPISMVESGPGAGVLGAATLGELIGERNLITLDIGGTTAKCSLIEDGKVNILTRYMLEKSHLSPGYPILTPSIDIVEIGTGGGSIAGMDEYGRLFVGPRSAGAVPGPAAYGRGGTDPTTTDANLVTGRIDPLNFHGGEFNADMVAVNAAFAPLASRLGMSVEETACGIIRVANHNMINALKLVSVSRGHDPRDFTMVAFGGGGGMHAAALAAELRIGKVIVPRHASVFSAWGMLLSDLRRDIVLTRPVGMQQGNAVAIVAATLREMETEAFSAYATEDVAKDRVYFQRFVDMRYDGQEHTVKVSLDDGATSELTPQALVERFESAFQKQFTYRLKNAVEIVNFHLVAFAKVDRPALSRMKSSNRTVLAAIKAKRMVSFGSGDRCETTVYERSLLDPGMSIEGPAIIEEPETSTVIGSGQRATIDDYGNILIVLPTR